jgi:outer membrane protein assembly factor BamA
MAAMICCQSVGAADREARQPRAKAEAVEILPNAGTTDNVAALTKYYSSLGFFRARVRRGVDLKSGSFHLVIEQGPRYRVTAIKLVGNHRFTDEELSKQLKTAAGNFVDQEKLNADLAALEKLYDRPGEQVQADLRFNDEPGDVETVYMITEAATPE